MSTSVIMLPNISCQECNHYNKELEFICKNVQCLKSNNSILCFYCLQSSHSTHNTLSLRTFINECQLLLQPTNSNHSHNKQTYQLQRMLLSGLSNCNNKQKLSLLLEQIYRCAYQSKDEKKNRIDKLVNEEMRRLKSDNLKKYLGIESEVREIYRGLKEAINIQYQTNSYNNNDYNHNQSHHKLPTSNTNNQFHHPILSFLPATDFTLISPFQIKHNRSHTLSTCFAQPSLNTYTQSLKIIIKIVRSTPNWIALGLCIGQPVKYEQSSKSHISILSNGWVNNKGELREEKRMIFGRGDEVEIRWDKKKEMIIFRNLTTKHQVTVNHTHCWSDSTHLFTSMYYKSDTISIVQSSLL